MKHIYKLLPLVLSLAFTVANPVSAITIDELQVDDAVQSSTTPNQSGSGYTASSRTLGGGRKLTAIKTGAGVGRTEIFTSGGVLGVTIGDHAGFASVVWDGDTTASTIKADGLPGINFLQDGATAFRFQLRSFDFAYSQNMTVSLRIYDPSLPNGTKYSNVAITINQPINSANPFIVEIPFSLFDTAGAASIPAPAGGTFATLTTFSAGGASATSVGALSLSFEGFAGDLTLTTLSTNGTCPAIPNQSGSAFDDCDLCLDDPDASQGKDACGVCFKGPSGYNYEANKVFDGCGLCPSQTHYQFPDGKKDPCGVCLGGQPPYTYQDLRDACGVCGGPATTPDTCLGGDTSCVLVEATADVKEYEKALVEKANTVRARYNDERRRAKRNGCKIAIAPGKKVVTTAYEQIMTRSRQIFSKGVEVCGNSCITTSYAEQVQALVPEFKNMQKETLSLARKVKQCYSSRGLGGTTTGQRGVSDTLGNVNRGLRDLIEKCKKQKVCPPGAA
jgi:hypothetical protein